MKAFASALLLLVGMGCGGPGLDRSRVEGDPIDGFPVAEVPSRGHQVEISVPAERRIVGELIAVDLDVLWVENEWGALRSVPRSQIEYVQVELYESDATALAAWTTLGTISVLSHGWFLIISGPVWLGAGIPAATVEGGRNDATATGQGLDPLFQFARFPQGMPHSLRAAADPGWRPPAMETAPVPARPPPPTADGRESPDGLSTPTPAP